MRSQLCVVVTDSAHKWHAIMHTHVVLYNNCFINEEALKCYIYIVACNGFLGVLARAARPNRNVCVYG